MIIFFSNRTHSLRVAMGRIAAGIMLLAQAAHPAHIDLSQELQSIPTSHAYPVSTVSMALAEVGSGTLLVAMRADSAMIPASVEKLLTAAAAFELLGTDYVFRTTVLLDPGFSVDSGTVNGNMYVRGGGDPGILTERLWLLAETLYDRGLRVVRGNLVLDASLFDSLTRGPGFGEDATSRAYESDIGALSSTFNCLGIHVMPGGAPGRPVRVSLSPERGDVVVVNKAVTAAIGSRAGLEVNTEVTNGKTRVVVTGSMALNEKPRYVFRKAWQPWENFGTSLRSMLARRGVRIEGSVRMGRAPTGVDTFLVFESQPLPEFVNHMFKYSSNFAAEMVFKSLGTLYDAKGVGTWQNGAGVVTRWWRQSNLPGNPIIMNGSGMGSGNRISAAQLVALLNHVWKSKEYLPEYLAALSVSGVDGTLKKRLRNSPLEGVVRAKTGTLNDRGVSTLAGYVLLPDRTYSFAILINSPRAQQYTSWTIQEKLLEKAVARLREGSPK